MMWFLDIFSHSIFQKPLNEKKLFNLNESIMHNYKILIHLETGADNLGMLGHAELAQCCLKGCVLTFFKDFSMPNNLCKII